MDIKSGEQAPMENDYFANELLGKLDSADPAIASFEAQAVSREVGFDFADFPDVVPRALDEIRETKEAFEEEGPDAREHFGDEVADIMFSLINLARHAGMDELPAFDALVESARESQPESVDTISAVDAIGYKIAEVADTYNTDDFMNNMGELYVKGMVEAIQIAVAHDFDPALILKENVRKYLVRCQAIEQLASDDGKQWADLSANNEIVAYWKKAKILLK